MGTISVKLPESLSQRLLRLSVRSGRSQDSYLVEALEEHLSDLEALELAEERLAANRAGNSGTLTQAEIEARYGVDD